MMTTTPTEPGKTLIRLEVIRPLFFKGQRLEVGDFFHIEAAQAGECLLTLRCKMADDENTHLVYRKSEVF